MFQTFVIQITLWFKKYKLCNTKLKHNNLVNHIVRPINNYILRHNITMLLYNLQLHNLITVPLLIRYIIQYLFFNYII